MSDDLTPTEREDLLTAFRDGVGARRAPRKSLAEIEAASDEISKRFMDYDPADDMCPNCVTPWKCNGPHLEPEKRKP